MASERLSDVEPAEDDIFYIGWIHDVLTIGASDVETLRELRARTPSDLRSEKIIVELDDVEPLYDALQALLTQKIAHTLEAVQGELNDYLSSHEIAIVDNAGAHHRVDSLVIINEKLIPVVGGEHFLQAVASVTSTKA